MKDLLQLSSVFLYVKYLLIFLYFLFILVSMNDRIQYSFEDAPNSQPHINLLSKFESFRVQFEPLSQD